MTTRIQGMPTDLCRATVVQTEWAWMQCGPAAGGLWHQRRVLGVVAESSLTTKDSRQVTILTPEGDVCVNRRSAQRPPHQPSSSQSSPPTPLPSGPDVPREIWRAQLSLKMKHKWTKDPPQVKREGWRALMALSSLPRDNRNMHRRHLVVGDAMAVIQPLSKGRTSSQTGPICSAASADI